MPRAQPGEKNNLQTPFLKAYAALGKVGPAAAAVGMNNANHYLWLRVDPSYRERFEAAKGEWQPRREARKAEALRRIGKLPITSVELLEDIEKLLIAYSYGPKRKTKRRAASVAKLRHGLLDQIARAGVFGVKYKDFASAPPAAQHTIRALAKEMK